MRTTLDIDERLLREVVERTGEKNRSRAANKAFQAYLRSEAVRELIALAGQIDIVDDREERRRMATERQERLHGIGRRSARTGQ
ncbi:MAG: type II toxin-antitoxin system VapB family antitoxin [Chloroflexi bacterium]|nr:type II toxin-antitoxin system VapB family antitoxin [Chloroflexota bacterium]